MHRKYGFGMTVLEIVMIILALAVLLPVALVVMNSVKGISEVSKSLLSLPKELRWDNFTTAMQRMNYWNALKNSLIVTACSVTGVVLFSSMAAYQITRKQCLLSKIIYYGILLSIAIPFQALMVPLVIVAKTLHLVDNIWGLILIYWGLLLPMSMFLYQGFIKNVPRELEEAALIDGCSPFRAFFSVVFPILKPITVTVVILNCLGVFNDFTLPLILLVSKANRTIPLSISVFFDSYANQWNYIMASLTLVIVPVLVAFLFLQKQIMKGMIDGALKG